MWPRFLPLLILGLAFPSLAQADPITLGSSGTGRPLNLMAAAIAKTAGRAEGLDVRVQPFRGSSQYVPLVNAGDLDGGVANALELSFAYKGEGTFDGRPNPDLRLIAATYPFRIAFFVPEKLSIHSPEELKGKRIGSEYRAARIATVMQDGLLANAGLSMADMRPVPVSGYGEARELMSRDLNDAIVGVVGSAVLSEYERKAGKLIMLPLLDTPEALAALRWHIPVAEVAVVEPGPRMVGVEKATKVLGYKFFLYSNADMDDDVAYKLAKAMNENKDELAKTAAPFMNFEPTAMASDVGVPYHPGAIGFYKEIGIWQDRN